MAQVQYSEFWHTWEVHSDYYGTLRHPNTQTRWIIEHITPNTERAANELAAKANAIDSVLDREINPPPTGAEALIFPIWDKHSFRLRAEQKGTRWHITNYDWPDKTPNFYINGL